MTTRPPGEASILRTLWVEQEIIPRLVKRYQLSDIIEGPDTLLLPRSIQLTSDVDELLVDWQIMTATLDLTGAGIVTAFTVPAGDRWRWTVSARPATTGTSDLTISDGTTSLQILAAGTAAVYSQWPRGLILEEGWTIRMAGTSNGADGARVLNIEVGVERSFRV